MSMIMKNFMIDPFSNPLTYDSSIIGAFLKCEKCDTVYDICLNDGRHTCPSETDYTKSIKLTGKKQHEGRKKNGKITLPTSGYSSLLPYQFPQVKEILENIYSTEEEKPKTIVDANCHIGGDTLLFYSCFPDAKIIAIDIDEKAVECLRLNLPPTAEQSIEIICTDSAKWILDGIGDSRKADLYYFDPPWPNGPSYINTEDVELYLSEKPITNIINYLLRGALTKKILLKVPKNFAYKKFKEECIGETKLFYIRKPQKNGVIAYGLVLISLTS